MKRPLNILDFSAYYHPHVGGLENYARELHEQLVRKGCSVTVFTPHFPKDTPSEEQKNGITIIRYPAFEIIFNFPVPLFWTSEFRRQWKRLRNERFDITIGTVRFFLQPLMAWYYAWLNHIPFIHIEHCSDFVKNRPFISLLSRVIDLTLGFFSLRQARIIITPSHSAARFVHRLSNRKSVTIYRGMPLAYIDSIPADAQMFSPGKTVIMFAGRLIYGKGVAHLLDAVASLNRPDIVVWIVGDGPERGPLQKLVAERNLGSQVHFFGSVPFEQVIGLMKKSDIFVNPSYNEGLPTSILEAGICRRAIIATDVGGTREIITADISGILIPAYSTDAIGQALSKLLDNPQERDRLGTAARRAIEQKFNWDTSVEQFLSSMENLKV